jgi:hypothetical protein
MAQDVGCIEQLILGSDASTGDCAAQKDAFGCSFAGQFKKEIGEFFWFEAGPAEIASGAEGAVETIALAGRAEQGLEQQDLPPARHVSRLDEQLLGLTGRPSRGNAPRTMILGWFQIHLVR